MHTTGNMLLGMHTGSLSKESEHRNHRSHAIVHHPSHTHPRLHLALPHNQLVQVDAIIRQTGPAEQAPLPGAR